MYYKYFAMSSFETKLASKLTAAAVSASLFYLPARRDLLAMLYIKSLEREYVSIAYCDS